MFLTTGTTKSDRRSFIKRSVAFAGLAVFSPLSTYASLPRDRALTFYHTHTGEIFELPGSKGRYSAQDRKKLYSFLRDFRTGDIHPMDIRLFSMLATIQEKAGSQGIYEVISGYRSPKTNEMLRANTSGVARKSFHMKGQAIDVRLRGVSTRKLRDIAISLQAGGVGYYRNSDFIHLDTGPVRNW